MKRSVQEMRTAVQKEHPGAYASEHQIYWVKIFTASGVALSSAELSEDEAWEDAFSKLSTLPVAAQQPPMVPSCV